MSRDEEIRLIWTTNQWLYMIVGFIGGILLCLVTQVAAADLPSFMVNLVPEAAGVFVTIIMIDVLNRRRDERNAINWLKEQLVLDAGSNIKEVALNAVYQLRKRKWLAGDQGVLEARDLSWSNLAGAFLHEANLQRTDFTGATLEGSDFGGANLQGSDFSGANLQRATFHNADLQGAAFINAKMRAARLAEANLQGANFEVADLQGADLFRSNMQNVDLRDARLQGAVLGGAKLQGANMQWANLQGADIAWANLQGANLKRARFDGAVLEGATLPDGTRWTPDTDMTRFTVPEDDSDLEVLGFFPIIPL